MQKFVSAEIRAARKVGHITIVGATSAEVRAKMAEISGGEMAKGDGGLEAGVQAGREHSHIESTLTQNKKSA